MNRGKHCFMYTTMKHWKLRKKREKVRRISISSRNRRTRNW